jgi:PIN domain nuclease of toxin-antitoxin system
VGSVLDPSPERYVDELLLLDTHVWLWYLEGGEGQLSGSALDLLRRANVAHRLTVCDVSVWELGIKAAKGRLELSFDLPLWVTRAERVPGITFLPLDRETLMLSTMLPEGMSGDPADRMLVASAILQPCPLVTKDRAIIEYARREKKLGLSVVDAR